MTASRRIPTILSALALLALSGCFGMTRTSASAGKWREGVRTVGLLSAIGIYEVHPGNVQELHEEWTAAGAKTVMSVLQDGLKRRGITSRVVSWKGEAELDEMRLLYGEVASAIFEYTYYPFPFPTKSGPANFDYGVGPIGPILDRAGVDVFIIAAGRDHVGANGRPVAFGGAKSQALLSLGLLDRAGKVIWFDVGAENGLDIRKEADARRLVERMLLNMPGVKR